MWSPSEVCSFAQKSDKVLESPQKIYTDGFIAAAGIQSLKDHGRVHIMQDVLYRDERVL